MAVQLIQSEEPVMPQAGQDPALRQQHALFGLGFIAGFIRARREDGRPVVLGPLLVAGVDVGIVAAGAAHPAAQVVGDDERGHAAEAGHGPGVAAQPVGEGLGPGGLGEGVIGGAQHRDKQLRRLRLPGAGIDDGHGIPAIIDKALLPGPCASGAWCVVAGRASGGNGRRTGSSCNPGSGSAVCIPPRPAAW